VAFGLAFKVSAARFNRDDFKTQYRADVAAALSLQPSQLNAQAIEVETKARTGDELIVVATALLMLTAETGDAVRRLEAQLKDAKSAFRASKSGALVLPSYGVLHPESTAVVKESESSAESVEILKHFELLSGWHAWLLLVVPALATALWALCRHCTSSAPPSYGAVSTKEERPFHDHRPKASNSWRKGRRRDDEYDSSDDEGISLLELPGGEAAPSKRAEQVS